MRITHRRAGHSVFLLCAALLSGSCGDGGFGVPPDGAVDLRLSWSESTPAAHGLDPAAFEATADLAGEQERMRSLLVVHQGELILERYFGPAIAAFMHDVRSVTKSIISTLVGFAIADGHITSVDQTLGEIIPQNVAVLRAEQQSITIEHLLTMSGGFAWDESTPAAYTAWRNSRDYLAYLLDPAMADAPGAAFEYNSAAVHLLGIALEEAIGGSLTDYADEKLFVPLGIGVRTWEEMGSNRVNGGAGLDLQARDLARLGQLFLQDGWSGNERVLPPGWADEASAPRFTWSFGFGPIPTITYGYLWWVDQANDAYFAWGYGGQFIYVVPRRDLVIVATTNWILLSREGGPDWLEKAVLDVIVDGVLAEVPPT
jgi:CubicO group peptidase (beta-lactamase class C family)